MMTALNDLLAAIRKHEAPKGYGQIYGGAKGVPKGTDVTAMTLNQVLAMQRAMVKAGSASTASGGYQFIRKTLERTIDEMGLSGDQVWTPELQDRMAVHLMEGRGLSKYLSGTLSAEAFANNLAMEWASLPVVTAIKGARGRILAPGQSYYAGDGLNKAFHKPDVIMGMVKALRAPANAGLPTEADKTDLPAGVQIPSPAPQQPIGLLQAIINIILAIFGRKPNGR